jgi:hypothetical protein
MMKKAIITIAAVIVALIGGHAIGQNVLNYMEQGGARWVVGGSLDVASGGDLDIESGGAFKLAGTEVTATAAELNKLDGLTQVLPSTLATNAVGVANSIWGGTNQLIFEGTSASTAEWIMTVANPATIDQTVTWPDATGTPVLSTLTTNAPQAANSLWTATGSVLVAEGATADDHEASVAPLDDPTSDVTVSYPSLSTGVLMISTLATNDIDVANSVWGVSGGITFEGSGASTAETKITVTNPATVDRTATFPDASGTIVLTGNITVSDSANQACNTTCGSATCIIGVDSATSVFITCDGATADSCLCLTAE